MRLDQLECQNPEIGFDSMKYDTHPPTEWSSPERAKNVFERKRGR